MHVQDFFLSLPPLCNSCPKRINFCHWNKNLKPSYMALPQSPHHTQPNHMNPCKKMGNLPCSSKHTYVLNGHKLSEKVTEHHCQVRKPAVVHVVQDINWERRVTASGEDHCWARANQTPDQPAFPVVIDKPPENHTLPAGFKQLNGGRWSVGLAGILADGCLA